MFILVAASVPSSFGFGNNAPPPQRKVGIAADGGLDCTACHRSFGPANSDPRGSIRIQAVNYRPGQTQTIRVTVAYPEAQRWGFQISARRADNPAQKAGNFIASEAIAVRCDEPAQAAVVNFRGIEGDCGDDRTEFASHANRDSTSPGTPNSKTFEIQWRAPTDDVGDVIFYAAGNASNNDNVNVNDRIYTTSAIIENDGACTLNTRPVVTTVRNAASGTANIAINTLISIFGQNFYIPGRQRELAPVQGKYRDTGGCLAVEVNGRRAPLLYVSPNQINAQLPSITNLGTAQVQVILNPGRQNEIKSDIATITLTGVAPAFFMLGGTNNIATIRGSDIIGDPAVNSAFRFARPGDVVSLYATGFGVTDPFWQAGEVTSEQLSTLPLDRLTITVGGTTLRREDILFAGVAPRAISGLYQFNIRLPDSLPDGNATISISTGGASTQTGGFIPIRRQ